MEHFYLNFVFCFSLCESSNLQKKEKKRKKAPRKQKKKNETNKRTKKRHRIEQYPQESWRKQHQ